MKKFNWFTHLIIFFSSLVLLFIIAPVLGLYLNTTPHQYVETIADNEVIDSIILTLLVSMLATFIFGIAAIPFAYLLAKKQFRFKRIINGIIDIPIVIPHSAAGIAILGIISRDTWLGKSAQYFGINFVSGTFGIATAMAFVSLPFLINAARDGFSAVPDKMEKAALSLGASPFQVFVKISLPLAWRSILSGFIMMFARGMSEFGAVVIIAYHPMIVPVLIYERFGAYGLDYSRPVAAIFVFICLCIFTLLRLLYKKAYVENR